MRTTNVSFRGARLRRTSALTVLTILPTAACTPDALPLPSADEHRAEVLAWHRDRLAALREPDGWLSVVGLYWLEEGESPFGSDSGNVVVFPPRAPRHIGTFVRTGSHVHMEVDSGVGVYHDGTQLTSLDLTPAVGREPIAELGSLRWFVIQREDQIGIRLKDTANPAIEAFDRIETFPVSLTWHLPARFDRADPPRTLRVPNVLGMVIEQPSPGRVAFQVGGRTYRLDVTGDPDADQYFIVFGDRTNGDGTYGGGRFLEIDAPDAEGRTFIDFNRAYNPPCVFTAFATCPLPTPENRLPIRVESGEKMYHGSGH